MPDIAPTIWFGVHVVLAAGLSLHALLRKKRPASTVLWLAVLWAFPGLGAGAYLAFGIDQVRRGGRERRVVAELWKKLLTREGHAAGEGGSPLPAGHPAEHVLRLTEPAVRPFRVRAGNRAELLVDGDEAYPRMLSAIAGARETIRLQTFILATDDTGRSFREALAERAGDGVDTRVLLDRFGSTKAYLTRFLRPVAQAGGHVATITQANPLKGRFQINLRNHRKLLTVDGHTAFLGGLNLDDRNVARGDRRPDRDYHVLVEGPVVRDLEYLFAADWYFATGHDPDRLIDPDTPPPDPRGEAFAQPVPGGPDREGRNLAHAFFGAIVAARESLTIVTPYFIPDETQVDAIVFAALHGVEVRLVVPGRSNHWYTVPAGRALYGRLLRAGVRIFERGPPFMHAKALLVDDAYAFVGSANLDYRSLHLNFELNLEIAERGFVRRVREQVEAEVAESREVTLEQYVSRGFHRRLVENVCFLFQPVL
ncbi:MAG: cardiolipin synthase [Gemmatimonadota bacterium]|nr:cardiolipin synthase [Gemmatimonadota bacterium]